MILSMTGYGKVVVDLPEKKVNIEIKSLNSKAMDLSTRMASLYREKEMEVRNLIAKQLERGKVDFSLWIEKKDTADVTVPINQSAMAAYYKRLSEIVEETGIPAPQDWFNTLLRMPEVMATKDEAVELTEEEWNQVSAGIQQAVQHLIDFRKQEGEALDKKFRMNIARIGELLASVEPYEKERVPKIKERILDSLSKLPVDYDKNRLEQELIYYIEKLDINEEKQRLANHLTYFISTMEGQYGQGKKLGFIAQEMGREINTLGSKSNHAEMQKIVVQMKDELEQIKEQVLNVM
ncbi:MAG: YicC family protein [Bacteroidaceae bacterium]|nr:YicC family protein [Bacteroidaceae bacterium]